MKCRSVEVDLCATHENHYRLLTQTAPTEMRNALSAFRAILFSLLSFENSISRLDVKYVSGAHTHTSTPFACTSMEITLFAVRDVCVRVHKITRTLAGN